VHIAFGGHALSYLLQTSGSRAGCGVGTVVKDAKICLCGMVVNIRAVLPLFFT
jgi:hypothetical protein